MNHLRPFDLALKEIQINTNEISLMQVPLRERVLVQRRKRVPDKSSQKNEPGVSETNSLSNYPSKADILLTKDSTKTFGTLPENTRISSGERPIPHQRPEVLRTQAPTDRSPQLTHENPSLKKELFKSLPILAIRNILERFLIRWKNFLKFVSKSFQSK